MALCEGGANLNPKSPSGSKKHPAPIVSLGKIIGYRIASSGMFIKTFDLLKDSVYNKLVTRIAKKGRQKQGSMAPQTDDFAFSDLDPEDTQADTNVNAAQGKESEVKLTTHKKAPKRNKEPKKSKNSAYKRGNAKRRFIIGYNPTLKSNKKASVPAKKHERNSAAAHSSRSPPKPRDKLSQHVESIKNPDHGHMKGIINDSAARVQQQKGTSPRHSGRPPAQEVTKMVTRSNEKRRNNSFEPCTHESSSFIAHSRKNRRDINIPNVEKKDEPMELNDCDSLFDLGPENEISFRSHSPARCRAEKAGINPSGSGRVRWADVITGKDKMTRRNKSEDRVTQNNPSCSKTHDQGKPRTFSPGTNISSTAGELKNVAREMDSVDSNQGKLARIHAGKSLAAYSPDVDDPENFPSLEETKYKKNRRDSLGQPRKSDVMKLQWKVVGKRNSKGRVIDIPIVRKSTVKEKKRRTKITRKLARLKNLRQRASQQKGENSLKEMKDDDSKTRGESSAVQGNSKNSDKIRNYGEKDNSLSMPRVRTRSKERSPLVSNKTNKYKDGSPSVSYNGPSCSKEYGQGKNKNVKCSSESDPCSSSQDGKSMSSEFGYVDRKTQQPVAQWGRWDNAQAGCPSDQDDPDLFPPLGEAKRKKNKTDPRDIDALKFPWRYAAKRTTKGKILDIPIVHKSVVKEKKQRTKIARKFAKSKNKNLKFQGTSTSQQNRRMASNQAAGDEVRADDDRKAETLTDVQSPRSASVTGGSCFHPSNSWYVIDNMPEVVIQPVGRVCPLHEVVSDTRPKQTRVVEGISTGFTVVSVDTCPEGSSLGWSSNRANPSPVNSRSRMDVCSEISEMSVGRNEELVSPLSSPRTRKRNSDTAVVKPNTSQRKRAQKEPQKALAKEESSTPPKKTSARYRALLRRDIGKVDVKTATEMFNRGRWVSSHQKDKVYDRFECHQHRRTNMDGGSPSGISQSSTVGLDEGSSHDMYQRGQEYVWLPQGGTDHPTINVIDGVIRTLAVLNNMGKMNK